ncbi:hypothetical protein H5410_021137 [Solanum commersonii]|uniref:Uncharacterized protein n=1 Tax=Solanum commersonii TaxID=4109 RepID=A0A9J5ZDD6_SOLCO|nr:hypothetical protein H5410_021137 [Solanum commersonii]
MLEFAKSTRRSAESLLNLPLPAPLKLLLHCNFQRTNPCSPKVVGDSSKGPSHRRLALIFKPIPSMSPIWLAKEVRRLADWIGEPVYNRFSVLVC